MKPRSTKLPTYSKDLRAAEQDRLEGLDGIRGLAVLMVIYAHLWLFDAGWVGMQSFFVLSGFLITRVLLNDRAVSNSFGDYLKRFYIRRILRVFPLYFSYLLIVALVLYIFGQTEHLSSHVLYASTYIYNYYHASAAYTHSFAFSHLWSMSVEEQFYLLWPLVMYLLPTAKKARNFLLAVVFAGPLLRAGTALLWPMLPTGEVTNSIPRAVFLITPCYLDAFAIGALLNFLKIRVSAYALFGASLIAMVVGMVINGPGVFPSFSKGAYFALGWPKMMPRGEQFIWGYTVINVLLFMLINVVITSKGHVHKLFLNPALDFLGKRSYSIYIVHFSLLGLSLPLIDHLIATIGNRPLACLLFSVGYIPLTIMIADQTYRRIEMPALQLKSRFSPRRSEPNPSIAPGP